jgi:ubiquinone biosynthesis protein COQ9
MERVPQVGFTTQAIQRSCLSLDYPDTPEQFEDNGGFELIKHYMVSRRLKTIENVKQAIKESESEGKKLNKDELLKLCFKKRIELSEPVIGKWSEVIITHYNYIFSF